MPRYSIERKEAVLKKLLPPHNLSVPQVAEEEGISEVTLYNWRSQLKESGIVVANSQSSSEQWSAQTKLAVVAETFSIRARLRSPLPCKDLRKVSVIAVRFFLLSFDPCFEADFFRQQI
ncbi:transposase [Vibrio sp. 10N.247.311.59]|uniref:transposase n=1 Tax=Vibrio sp. 10N.247.311.59 TaxID=3229989 RepID=UPI00354EAEAA